jgi:TonB family protein
MSASQTSNAFDLLGQSNEAPPAVHLPGWGEPQLEISWGAFRQSFSSSVSASLNRSAASRKFLSASFFRDAWIERKFPRKAVAAAALWHLALIVLPSPEFSGPRHDSALDNTVLTWSGPIEDLPLLEMRGNKPKPSPRGEVEKPLPPKGADAFHPRQRIFTDPVRPTHPRQTLINPQAPPDAPKLLPNLPNIVQIAPSTAPARPKLEISERVLKSLRPRQKRATTTNVAAPAPDVQNNEVKPADLTIANTQNVPARPQLELNTGSAPFAAKRKQTGETAAAPEMASAPAASNGADSTFIALSATPGPAAPVEPPQGNLAARIAISPEGKQHGAPGGLPAAAASNGGAGGDHSSSGGAGTGSGTGKNPVGVSISGGNPSSNTSGLSGVKPKLDLSATRTGAARPLRDDPADPPPVRTAPPNFADLAPGAKPEAIFASKRVYTMHVNMPNLNSATGSWIINFSELRADPSAPRVALSGDVAAPLAIKKVDPKYPPTLIAENVEGEVILYAVIRRDGTVDSIQLVRGVDEQLDENAMKAFAQWRFRPAEKQGETVDLEAIVHIPFRIFVNR